MVAILFSGCVNISDTAKAGGFGSKNSKEQKAYDYFKGKYGDPAGSGAPRLIEPMMTTSVTDNMPVDKVLKYNRDAPAFIIWFFYDNFAETDAIAVAFKYLDDGTVIHTFNSKGGGDYGAGTFTLQKPDDGWPLGNYEATVSGKGVSESVKFDVIEGPTVKVALPYEGGVEQPKHEPEPPATVAPATTAGMTSDKIIFETDPGYIGACSLTDTAKWTFTSPLQVSLLQVWYNWGTGESTLAYTLKKDGQEFSSGTLIRADCDPYQGNWCNGNYKIGKPFPAGSYELALPIKKMCLEPGKTGAVRLYGTAQASAAPALPEDVPTHLNSCQYSGSWSTDWGAMALNQDDSKVTGSYTWDSGKLAGTLVDGVFVGKWSESPSYSEPRDGGDAIFYFTKDCSSFTGNWHYGVHPSGTGWSGTWVGTKSK